MVVLVTFVESLRPPEGEDMKQELVKDWMSRDVITVTADTLLSTAERLLIRHTIRRLPVVDKDGRLVGILTYGDIRRAKPSPAQKLSTWELNRLMAQMQVGDIMTPNPITIAPNTTISDAAGLMLKNMVSGLPVVDAQQRVLGIITESDIFRLVVREWGHLPEEVPEPYAHYG